MFRSNSQKPNLPVFIVGVPRSGTTLMRLLLNAHPEIAIPDETGILSQLFIRPGVPKSGSELREYHPSGRVIESLGATIVSRFNRKPRILRPNRPERIVETLFREFARSKGKSYWGEKTPLHTDYINDIAARFSPVTILYMVRDPRAVVASYLRYRHSKHRTPGDQFVSDTMQEAIDKYKSFMQSSILIDISKTSRLFFVSYEALVQHPERLLRTITEDKLGIEYSASMLEYYKDAKIALNSGASRQGDDFFDWKSGNLDGIDRNLANRWRLDFSDTEIEIVTEQLAFYSVWSQEVLHSAFGIV